MWLNNGETLVEQFQFRLRNIERDFVSRGSFYAGFSSMMQSLAKNTVRLYALNMVQSLSKCFLNI